MEEEIFGPILPVLTYEKIDDVIEYINSKPAPLVLYVFSRDRKFYRHVINNVISGDCLINDVIAHFANPRLPFGGTTPVESESPMVITDLENFPTCVQS